MSGKHNFEDKRMGAWVALPHLQAWRLRQRFTMRALAARAQVSPTTISGLENGHIRANFTTLGKLATALGITPEALLKAPPDEDLNQQGAA